MEFTVFYTDVARSPVLTFWHIIKASDEESARKLFLSILPMYNRIQVQAVLPSWQVDPSWYHNCYAEADYFGTCQICGKVVPRSVSWYETRRKLSQCITKSAPQGQTALP